MTKNVSILLEANKNMIPFIDLKTQFKHLEKEIQAAINGVLEHGKFILGPEINELEERLADFAGVKHVISCASGTDALLMPLMAQDVGPGDLVFTTPFTFIATAEVISLLGATPVFVDIDSRTFNIDPDKLKLAIEAVKKQDSTVYPLPKNISAAASPKVLIPVDLFGLPADYDPIMEIAEKENLFVLEDAAQGFGGTYKGIKAGGLGHAGATSFFPAKPLGCYGDGGAIFTNDDELHEKLISIRVHGQGKDKYNNIRTGLNARLDTIQAAILIQKLKIFPQELTARQIISQKYTQALADLHQEIITPTVPSGYSSSWAQYSLLTDKREAIMQELNKEGIPTAIYYPIPLHLQAAYSYLKYQTGDFPISESVSKRIFSLPMHPYLEHELIDRIAAIIRQAARVDI
jgi:UDP-2-acetamido-2-deoxy-ribo-hexuluronate aminotransferase